MKSRSVFDIVLIIALYVAVTWVGISTGAVNSPTIEFEKPVHFITPGGDDVVVGPGTFSIEAKEGWLQLTPIGAEKTESVLVQAEEGQHEETLQKAKALSVSDAEDWHRVALLLANGTSFEAVGSYSGVRSRRTVTVQVTRVQDPSNTQGRGIEALNKMNSFNLPGRGNTATGHRALRETYRGNLNTAMGADALRYNSSGNTNTAMGFVALRSNTASVNTAVGGWALTANTVGTENTAVGGVALKANTKGSKNTAVGAQALNKNTTGSFNTATGYGALTKNTGGLANTATGFEALSTNNGGHYNTATGYQALMKNLTGKGNTANGYNALSKNAQGEENMAAGNKALEFNEKGSFNVAIGSSSLRQTKVGMFNTAVGHSALSTNTSGGMNIAIGNSAGMNLRIGSRNIYVGARGSSRESDTIRIGQDGAQKRTFLAGIRGKRTGMANAVGVVIDSKGQLGTVNSSRRFKEDIHDMGKTSRGLLQLRPVTYLYKEPYADGAKPIQYGLIAEEVAEVYPEIVTHNAEGEVESVQYRKLITMLLNELQNQHKQVNTEKEKNLVQEQQIHELRSQLTVVNTQFQQLQDVAARLARLEKVSQSREVLAVQRLW